MPNCEWWSADGCLSYGGSAHDDHYGFSMFVQEGYENQVQQIQIASQSSEFCHSSFYYFFSMCSQNFCWMLVELFVPELGEATLGWIMHAWKMQICWLIFGKYLHMHAHSRQSFSTPQWDTADTEIQVLSFENPELTDLPLKPGEGHSLYRAMQLLLLPGVSVCVCVCTCMCVHAYVYVCVHAHMYALSLWQTGFCAL